MIVKIYSHIKLFFTNESYNILMNIPNNLQLSFVVQKRCFYAICFLVYDLKNAKNIHGGVLLLVKFTKINTTPWVFWLFLKILQMAPNRENHLKFCKHFLIHFRSTLWSSVSMTYRNGISTWGGLGFQKFSGDIEKHWTEMV